MNRLIISSLQVTAGGGPGGGPAGGPAGEERENQSARTPAASSEGLRAAAEGKSRVAKAKL